MSKFKSVVGGFLAGFLASAFLTSTIDMLAGGEYDAPIFVPNAEIVQVRSLAEGGYEIGVNLLHPDGEEVLVETPWLYETPPRLGDTINLAGAWNAYVKRFYVSHMRAPTED